MRALVALLQTGLAAWLWQMHYQIIEYGLPMSHSLSVPIGASAGAVLMWASALYFAWRKDREDP
jgi:hypothetical protein